MSNLSQERVLSVHHWNERLFSFTTTRDPGLRFRNGHFVMMGLEVDGRPLLRAYSVASAHYDDHLEFYSIKVPDGPLTSRPAAHPARRLRSSSAGSRPARWSSSNLLPGKRLYLLGTGTGLAPFMSIIRDPETYERFEQVIVVHGVRHVSRARLPRLHRERAAATRVPRRARSSRSCATTRPSRASPSETRAASPTCSRAASSPPTSACRRSTPRTTA